MWIGSFDKRDLLTNTIVFISFYLRCMNSLRLSNLMNSLFWSRCSLHIIITINPTLPNEHNLSSSIPTNILSSCQMVGSRCWWQYISLETWVLGMKVGRCIYFTRWRFKFRDLCLDWLTTYETRVIYQRKALKKTCFVIEQRSDKFWVN